MAVRLESFFEKVDFPAAAGVVPNVMAAFPLLAEAEEGGGDVVGLGRVEVAAETVGGVAGDGED